MPAINQRDDGGFGVQGTDGGKGGLAFISFAYNAPADTSFFTADREYIVDSATARVEVLGTDTGAVTAVLKKAASGTAIASGTALHTGTINLKGTDNTNQALTITAAAARIPAGTSIGLDVTGTTTAAVGNVTLGVRPA